MKKVLIILGLLVMTAGGSNANPMPPHNDYQKAPAPMHRIAPMPKPIPVVYQVPVQTPIYSNGYSNFPYVTFSLGNVDVTLGL